jgi:hypothetical protein
MVKKRNNFRSPENWGNFIDWIHLKLCQNVQKGENYIIPDDSSLNIKF